jgi:hypothetical protein
MFLEFSNLKSIFLLILTHDRTVNTKETFHNAKTTTK